MMKNAFYLKMFDWETNSWNNTNPLISQEVEANQAMKYGQLGSIDKRLLSCLGNRFWLLRGCWWGLGKSIKKGKSGQNVFLDNVEWSFVCGCSCKTTRNKEPVYIL